MRLQSGLQCEIFVNPPFMENTFVIHDDREAYLVDPGGSVPEIIAYLEKNHLKAKAIINTHGHVDHVVGVAELRERLKIPFHMHQADLFLLQRLPQIAESYGYCGIRIPPVDHFITLDSKFQLGNVEITISETPGHTPGSICFHIGNDVIVGDFIFLGSVGRTDLPGGDPSVLAQSIEIAKKTWKPQWKLFPGHGSPTTMGHEIDTNPFFRPGAFG